MGKKRLPENTADEAAAAETQSELKRCIYERLSPRRRKFVDRLGYADWNPFAPPKEPPDLRGEDAGLAARRLAQAFFCEQNKEAEFGADRRAVEEFAMGLAGGQGKYRAVLEFCLWYGRLDPVRKDPGQGD
ncbi:MAG: hypothetical protein LBU06_06195 [Desulfovibrio sp.]|jgi:hypothetical protein|nr:hypothetical protein [Desulfovibrio sp.]